MPALLALVLAAAPLSEAVLANTIIDDHNKCRAERDEWSCRTAKSEYREYLRRFPDDKKVHDLHFFHGELLWDFAEYEEAAREYARALEANPTGKWARHAAWNRVLAWDALWRQRDLQPPSGRGPTTPLPIPREKRELMAAADAFVARFPDDDKRFHAEYAAAKVLYDHNHLEAAIRRYGGLAVAAVGKRFENGDPIDQIAANLALDGCRLTDDWGQVKAWAQRFLAARIGADGFRDDLVQQLAESEIRLQRLSGAAAARVWREAARQVLTIDARVAFQTLATAHDGDPTQLVAAQLARIEAEPTTDHLRLAADMFENAGQHDKANELRVWADWLDGVEGAAEPPDLGEDDGEPVHSSCGLAVEDP